MKKSARAALVASIISEWFLEADTLSLTVEFTFPLSRTMWGNGIAVTGLLKMYIIGLGRAQKRLIYQSLSMSGLQTSNSTVDLLFELLSMCFRYTLRSRRCLFRVRNLVPSFLIHHILAHMKDQGPVAAA